MDGKKKRWMTHHSKSEVGLFLNFQWKFPCKHLRNGDCNCNYNRSYFFYCTVKMECTDMKPNIHTIMLSNYANNAKKISNYFPKSWRLSLHSWKIHNPIKVFVELNYETMLFKGAPKKKIMISITSLFEYGTPLINSIETSLIKLA